MPRKNSDVSFIVKLGDGSEHTIAIDSETLKTGDHVARKVAADHQRKGDIPAGIIVKVRRAPAA